MSNKRCCNYNELLVELDQFIKEGASVRDEGIFTLTCVHHFTLGGRYADTEVKHAIRSLLINDHIYEDRTTPESFFHHGAPGLKEKVRRFIKEQGKRLCTNDTNLRLRNSRQFSFIPLHKGDRYPNRGVSLRCCIREFTVNGQYTVLDVWRAVESLEYHGAITNTLAP